MNKKKNLFPHKSVKKAAKSESVREIACIYSTSLCNDEENTALKHPNPSVKLLDKQSLGTFQVMRKSLCTIKFACFPLPISGFKQKMVCYLANLILKSF